VSAPAPGAADPAGRDALEGRQVAVLDASGLALGAAEVGHLAALVVVLEEDHALAGGVVGAGDRYVAADLASGQALVAMPVLRRARDTVKSCVWSRGVQAASLLIPSSNFTQGFGAMDAW
jgi:hypothetical protein